MYIPKGKQKENGGTTMKYTIEAIENAKTGMKWSDIGVQWTLAQAYLYSKDAGNELSNFAEVIWDEDIETILADCRLGIEGIHHQLHLSASLRPLRFEDLGCTLDGIVKFERCNFGSDEHALIPAFKMTVKEA